MEGLKIYGLCLERLRHQIEIAKYGPHDNRYHLENWVLLESYQTNAEEEIIDILDLYDIEDRTRAGVNDRLEDLALTVSVFARQTLRFDLTPDGNLGLYLSLTPRKSTILEAA
ncbi:MAG: hypothetical protein ACLPX5_12475 [Dissulfurispiraceae bacterium]